MSLHELKMDMRKNRDEYSKLNEHKRNSSIGRNLLREIQTQGRTLKYLSKV